MYTVTHPVTIRIEFTFEEKAVALSPLDLSISLSHRVSEVHGRDLVS